MIGYLVFHCPMTDVIRRTGSVAGRSVVSEGGSRIAARLSSQPQVLHGARSGDVQLTELTSGQPLYKLGKIHLTHINVTLEHKSLFCRF